MKRILHTAWACTIALTVWAQDAKPQFTILKQNPITSVKNQNRSGTCWDFATVGFFESEILRQTGRTYDLSEMFVASKDYMDCADYHVRMHGFSRFSEGGSCDDVLNVIRQHGICPESAMPVSSLATGDSLANFNEFFSLLEPYVEAVAKTKEKQITTQWKEGLQGILDAYLGFCPKEFDYEGQHYTPLSFAAQLGLNWNDYVSITSFTHHPFYTSFVIEAPYKWRPQLSWNVPLDELMGIIDEALERGYNVAWGGDVSEAGFTRSGLAIACTDKAEFDKLGFRAPETDATQAIRQQRFDTWQSTYDHVMQIFGRAKDQNGREYYMVKNSWGETGDYQGIWYMSRNFIALNTTYVFLNRNALSKSIQ
jgi:aminopeptidase C